MDELNSVLDRLNIKEFRLTGNKVIIDNMYIETSVDKRLFKKLKYYFIIEDLVASYIPKCVSFCTNLSVFIGNKFDGYLPKVTKYLSVRSGNKAYSVVHLDNIECLEMILRGNKYEGFIKTNKLDIGYKQASTTVGDLVIERIGSNSSVKAIIRNYEGTLEIKNMDEVKLGGVKYLHSTACVRITSCKILDLTDLYSYGFQERTERLILDRVETLIVKSPFCYGCVLEVDKVVFADDDFMNLDINSFESLFICNEFVLSGKIYTKNNPNHQLNKIIKFK